MTAHADSFERQASQRDLLRDLDRLVEKVTAWGERVQRLRAERAQAVAQVATLQGEKERLLQDAGVADRQALLGKVARLSDLERVNEALLRERSEMARRLETLIEKVDLLRDAP